MSAVFGLLARDGAPGDRAQLAAMDAALADAGPDGSGSWASGPVALGHRLACFTPEDRAERQPLAGADGRLALVVDGRIDNRAELAQSLGVGAEERRGLRDSALVMRAYERWGEACLEHLVGDFSLAVWNGRAGTLTLARAAPLGRPLFYHEAPHAFAFASHARGLFALPHVERAVDEVRLAASLAFAKPDPNASFFRDVRRVGPGQTVTFNSCGAVVTDWWQPDLRREIRYRRDEDYVAAFEELFERVIAAHLRSASPTGIFLSGGLDSSSIAAIAATQLRAQGGRLAAYTEVPPAGFAGPALPGRYADETPFVKELARMHQNIDLRLVRDGARGLLHGADAYFSAAEMPFRNAANRGWTEAIYARARDEGVKVLLSGDYGNLTATWTGDGLLPELVGALRLRQAAREARATARAGRARSTTRALVRDGVLPLLPIGVSRAFGGRATLSSLVHPQFASAHRFADRSRRLPRSQTRAIRLRVLLTTSLSEEIRAGYRASFGIDTRAPLADRRLVEFCLALPESQYAGGGQTRLLIRRTMAPHLPREILDKGKRGLQAANWYDEMSSERETLLAEAVSFDRDPLTARVLDVARLRRLLEDWPSADVAADPRAAEELRGGVGAALMAGRFIRWVQRG